MDGMSSALLIDGPAHDPVIAGDTPSLQILLCANETIIITIDPRTGRFTLRDTGDLAAAGRGPRFAAVTEKINMNPIMIIGAVIGFRYTVSL